MTIDSQIEEANKTIRNSKIIEKAAKLLLKKKEPKKDTIPTELKNLNETMEKISKMTARSMKGAMLAESRAKSRLVAVKKASAQAIKHTARAKRAAISSKTASQAAMKILKNQKTHSGSNYQKSYNQQIKIAIKYAKESEKETKLALKASKTARHAARMQLEPLRF